LGTALVFVSRGLRARLIMTSLRGFDSLSRQAGKTIATSILVRRVHVNVPGEPLRSAHEQIPREAAETTVAISR
jgi:hypothetical protein